MKYDKFGQAYTAADELCDALYQNPDLDIGNFLVSDWDQYNSSVKETYADLPLVKEYHPYPDDYSIEVFDQTRQSQWYMPAEYQTFDIVQWLLDQCQDDDELQRVGQELLLFQERDLIDLLRYLKYFVDTMRANNVIWGLGRGSSVSSYCLYLIGVHKINSIYYQLDIGEFLK